MGSSTSTFALPYPVTTDPADVPADVKALADRLEIVLGQLQAATPAQPLAGDLKWVGYPVAAGSEGTQCPGWLLCDGRAVSRSTYAALFAKVGTAHGAGDGTSTFNLPDARGRSPMGAGTGPGLTARSLGQKIGEESHVISVGEMPSHDHGGATSAGTLAAHSTNTGSTGTGSTGTGSTGTGTSGTQPATNTGTESADHSHAAPSHAHTFTAEWKASYAATSTSTVVTDVGDGSGATPGNQYTVTTSAAAGQTGGRSAAHTHQVPAHSHTVPSLSVPALAIPALSIPALGINAQPIPPLTIASQGGGAAANVTHPCFVAHCLIKT